AWRRPLWWRAWRRPFWRRAWRPRSLGWPLGRRAWRPRLGRWMGFRPRGFGRRSRRSGHRKLVQLLRLFVPVQLCVPLRLFLPLLFVPLLLWRRLFVPPVWLWVLAPHELGAAAPTKGECPSMRSLSIRSCDALGTDRQLRFCRREFTNNAGEERRYRSRSRSLRISPIRPGLIAR